METETLFFSLMVAQYYSSCDPHTSTQSWHLECFHKSLATYWNVACMIYQVARGVYRPYILGNEANIMAKSKMKSKSSALSAPTVLAG